MVMSSFWHDSRQLLVGENGYLLEPSISGLGLMQFTSRGCGKRHRSCGTRSRALTRGRVTSQNKRPHSIPSRVLGRQSPLGDGAAAVDGKLQGEGAVECSCLNPGWGRWSPSPDSNFTAPNRKRIERMSRRLIPTTIWLTSFGYQI